MLPHFSFSFPLQQTLTARVVVAVCTDELLNQDVSDLFSVWERSFWTVGIKQIL